MQMSVFGIIATLIWTLVHLYVGHRLVITPRLRRPWSLIVWGLLAADLVAAVATFSMRRDPPQGLFWEVLPWVAYVGMGAFVLLLFLIVVKDLAHLLVYGWERLRQGRKRRASHDPERRRFLARANMGVFLATGVGTSLGVDQALDDPELERVEVPLPDLPEALDGFTIAQLSDIHVGPTIDRAFVERVVARVNDLQPDLIAVTGDLIDGYVEEKRGEVAPLAGLQARFGKYFVPGNHEYYWDAPAWLAELARLGFEVLPDAHRLVEVGEARLLVAGVEDYSQRRKDRGASSPTAAKRGAPAHDLSLLLAHQPKSIYEAAEAGFDLQLSGHTHGGQFWPWNLFVGLAHPFTQGLGRYQEKTLIYVSRGTGYWGPPMRLGVPAEITLLTLRRA